MVNLVRRISAVLAALSLVCAQRLTAGAVEEKAPVYDVSVSDLAAFVGPSHAAQRPHEHQDPVDIDALLANMVRLPHHRFSPLCVVLTIGVCL
jgi:hypothetical protein